MGDVAIKAFNEVSRNRTGKLVILGGSTYKIRNTPYYYSAIRVFPRISRLARVSSSRRARER